jgi:hypothetical protein
MEYLPTTYFLAFLPIKLLAFIGWSYQGFFYLKLHYSHPKLRAIVYGLIRLLIGLLLALALASFAMMIFDSQKPILTGLIAYIIVYLPMRWFEWGLLEIIMSPKSRSFNYFIFGINKLSRRWRLGGLLICGLLDLSLIYLTMGEALRNIYLS